MPRWTVWALAGLAVLAAAAIVLEGVTIFAVITRLHQTQMELCRLYLLLHRQDQVIFIPPRCLP